MTTPTIAEMEARVAVFMDWKHDGHVTWRAPDGCGYFNPPSYASDLNLWPAIHARLVNSHLGLFRCDCGS